MHRTITLTLTALAALPACENFVTIDATIEVSPEAQAKFSAAAPGEIRFGFDMPKTGTEIYSLGVLCDPSDAAIAVELLHDDFGCAKEATAYAWIQEAPGAACGLTEPEPAIGASDLEVPLDAPQASAVLFPGETSRRGCDSGEQTLELRIE